MAKFKDICTKIGSGATPKGGKEAYCEDGISLIRSQNVLDFTFSAGGLAYINELQAEKLKNVIVEEDDVLLNITGDSVARACIVDKKYLPARVNQHVCIIRADSSKAIPSYLLYYLQLNKEYLLQLASGGATRNALTKDMINNLELELPTIKEQQKVVAVLDDIQKKIDFNNAINENLEQQISSIYANFCESKSWKPCELGSIIYVKDGTHDSPKPQTSGYLLVTSKHLLPYGVDRITPNRITEKDFKKINERSLVEQGDVLMSMIGTIGLISFVTEREIDYAIKNVALFKTSRTPNLTYYFLTFLKSNKTQQYIEMCLAGSTQKYISLGELRKMPIPVPDSETLECFNEIVSPMYQAIILNSQGNYAFAALRDSLLPKLMSGEINVSKIDI